MNSNYWTNGGLIKTLSIVFLFATGLGSGAICLVQILTSGDIKSSIAAGTFLAILTLSSHSLGVQSGISASVPPIQPLLTSGIEPPISSQTTVTTNSPRSGH